MLLFKAIFRAFAENHLNHTCILFGLKWGVRFSTGGAKADIFDYQLTLRV
ncbi:hypothetical protein CRENPOLYSF1_50006 [Crenothrix polyspora]|uniref:Uncharacterized protein n=1 Tax=Crenothrix polyspora TaxID=360316 RepID=A0A1R4HDC6_9GAMM|nr:hypothetical protein CRENPOLYSF1_50006 [Crenothrix polyspora]